MALVTLTAVVEVDDDELAMRGDDELEEVVRELFLEPDGLKWLQMMRGVSPQVAKAALKAGEDPESWE